MKISFSRWIPVLGLSVFSVVAPAQQPSTPPEVEPQPEYVRHTTMESVEALETAIVRFTRGEDTVDLVAVVHLGDEGYYDFLNVKLQEYDTVLYEMVGGEFSQREQNLASEGADPQVAGIRAAHGLIKTLLDMEYQLEGIDYTQPNFVHADVKWDEYDQLMKDRNQSMATLFQRAFFLAQTGETLPGVPSDNEGANQMIAQLFSAFSTGDTGSIKSMLAPVLGGAEGLIQKIEGEDGTVLITERNKVAMRQLTAQEKPGGQSVAIFYGAGHMPDLAARLEADGYQKATTTWITAWDIQPTPAADQLTPLQKATRSDELTGAIFNVLKGMAQQMADDAAGE